MLRFADLVFQTSYISILLMQRKYCRQVGESRSRSRIRLQNQYEIQNAQSYQQFVRELASEITGKVSINLLHSSTATENGEIQNLQSFRQNRKGIGNMGMEPKGTEKCLQSVVNRNKDILNLATFSSSLLSIKENLGRSKLSNPVADQALINYLRKESSNAQISLNDFESAQNSQNSTSKNGFYFPGQILYQDMTSTCHETKTLKILPKNSLNQALINYSQVGCQTESLVGNLKQCSPQAGSKIKPKKRVAFFIDQQPNLVTNGSQELDISLDKKCKQKSKTLSPLKKLKRSQQINEELSFESQKQDKACILEKDFFELEDQELNRIHEKYTRSETGSEQGYHQHQQHFTQKQSKFIQQIQQLSSENQTLKQTLLCAAQELEESHTRQQQLIGKNIELQGVNVTINERLAQLLEEYKQLIFLVQQYKQQIFDFQSQRHSFHSNIANLQKQLNECQVGIQKKEQEVSYLQKQVHRIKEQYSQIYLISRQLEQVLKAKSQELQVKVQQIQKERVSHAQSISFYQDRLNNEGVFMNIDQLKQIQEFIESQRDEQAFKMQHLERHYQKQLSKMEQQGQVLLQVITKLQQQKLNFKTNQQNQKASQQNQKASQQNQKASQQNQKASQQNQKAYEFQRSSAIRRQFEDILRQYDRQLQIRDQQIFSLKKQLKKQMQYHNQFCYDNYAGFIDQVERLRCSMNFENGYSQLQAQFGYIVDKLTKINSILSNKNKHLEHQKTQIAVLMQKVQGFYIQEIEGLKKQLEHAQIRDLQFEKQLRNCQLQLAKLEGSIQAARRQPKRQQYEHIAAPMALKRKKDSLQLNQLKQTSFQQGSKQKKDLLNFKKINLQRKYDYAQKLKISEKLVQAFSNRLKTNKKIESIFVNEIYLRQKGAEFEIEFIRKPQKEQDSTSQKQMLYCAPQVLLGFMQSQQSYVWMLGVLIDELFEKSPFYKKLNEIKCRKDNYYCRNFELKLKGLLQSMLRKNHKARITLQQVKNQISNEINSVCEL